MSKKEKVKPQKLPKKLDVAWKAYMVDMTAGPRLMMIGARFPERAEKLNQILFTGMDKLYKELLGTVKVPGVDVKEAADIIVSELLGFIQSVVNSFIKAQLSHTLLTGMPDERPRILSQVSVPPGLKLV
jgi:hypothetical protein